MTLKEPCTETTTRGAATELMSLNGADSQKQGLDDETRTEPHVDSQLLEIEQVDATIVDRNSPRSQKLRIWKNSLAASSSIMFLFLGFTGLHNLQSSLHREGGLGVINLAVLYGTYAVCGLFLGSIIVGRLGWKWSMVVAELGYVLWMAANLYAVWATLIPAAAITGLAASILWTAHGPYIAECGILLGNFEGHTRSSAIALLTGVDMALHSMAAVIGNLISTLVLSKDQRNVTEIRDTDVHICGANSCPAKFSTSNHTGFGKLLPPSKSLVWTLVGVYIGAAVLAMVICIFLADNIRPEGKPSKLKCSPGKLIATIKLLTRDTRQLLLIPSSFLIGWDMGFSATQFSVAFVACTLGINNVGMVMLVGGAARFFISLAVGFSASKIGRIPLLSIALSIAIATQVVLLLWIPRVDQGYVLYLLAVAMGITSTTMMVMIRTLYGAIFTEKREPAFANFKLLGALGFVCSTLTSDYICMRVKIYIYMGLVLISLPSVLFAEYLVRKTIKGGCIIPCKSTSTSKSSLAKE